MIQCFALTALLAVPMASSANDGLAAQLTIEKHHKSSDAHDTYSNSILMAFNTEVAGNLDGYYHIILRSGPLEQDRSNLLVTLKEIRDGKPYYVGSKPVEFQVGENASVVFELSDFDYIVNFNTAYGELE